MHWCCLYSVCNINPINHSQKMWDTKLLIDYSVSINSSSEICTTPEGVRKAPWVSLQRNQRLSDVFGIKIELVVKLSNYNCVQHVWGSSSFPPSVLSLLYELYSTVSQQTRRRSLSPFRRRFAAMVTQRRYCFSSNGLLHIVNNIINCCLSEEEVWPVVFLYRAVTIKWKNVRIHVGYYSCCTHINKKMSNGSSISGTSVTLKFMLSGK